jgi:SAM-dependent methyltransferase
MTGPSASSASSVLAAPYGALAPHYDAVMAHVDYPGWASHLRGLWRGAQGSRKHPARVLELAAGTCRFAAPPLFPNAFMVHTDLNPEMLRQAPAGTKRVVCDARALPFRSPSGLSVKPARAAKASGEAIDAFDLVLMVYDSLNYLMQPEEVLQALAEAKRLLRPGGVFLFDVTTSTCSRRHFADTLDFQETEGAAVVRASRYDAETGTQLNLFTFFTAGPDGRYDRREEVHRQRVYPAADLKKLARESGFSVRGCLADFTLKPGSDRDERLHFVLQKP